MHERNRQNGNELSYEMVCNDPIHPSVTKKQIPFHFEILKIKTFKGKEDPTKHVKYFIYS